MEMTYGILGLTIDLTERALMGMTADTLNGIIGAIHGKSEVQVNFGDQLHRITVGAAQAAECLRDLTQVLTSAENLTWDFCGTLRDIGEGAMIRIDLSAAEESGRAGLLPRGDYEATVMGLTEKEGPKGPYLEWSLKLVEANGQPEVRLRTSLTPKSLWVIKRTLSALGLPHTGVVSFSEEDVVGLPCMVSIAHEDYQGTKQARAQFIKETRREQLTRGPDAPDDGADIPF